MFKKLKGDKVIWSIVILLSLVSVLAVFSSTRTLAYRMDKHATFYLIKQLFFLAVGFGIIYFVHKRKYTVFKPWAKFLYYLSLPLLLYTLFFGAKINEGTRWIKLPVINVTFQSSDLAKLALFMYLSYLLSIKQDVIKDLKKGFLPILMPVIFTCLLIMPANMSTALLLGFTCCILFFIGRVRIKHIAMLAVFGIAGALLMYGGMKMAGIGRAATWEKRVVDFMDKGKTEEGEKKQDVYQVEQAKIAIANGGFIGSGPGHSKQRDYLPEAYSDFIFSSIIEEYGIVGGAGMVFLYLLFLWRSILIFRRCPYGFGAFLAVGLSITLVFQAMINMAVNVHLVPVTGLTLPLVSMGGSSIWFTSIAIGIILSVSRYVDEIEGKKQKQNSENPVVTEEAVAA